MEFNPAEIDPYPPHETLGDRERFEVRSAFSALILSDKDLSRDFFGVASSLILQKGSAAERANLLTDLERSA